MARAGSGRPLVAAGFVIWVVVGLAEAAAWASSHLPFDRRALASCAAYAVFASAFLLAAGTRRLVAWRPMALAIQSAAALVVVAFGKTGFEGALLCVVAGQAPLLVGEKKGLAFVIAQTAIMVALYFMRGGHLWGVAAYGGFQLFAFGATRFAAREAEGREELSRVHAELLATRELFADATRTAERLRIARELHDAIGHHLTALSLQLELARNLEGGRAKEPVDQAHALTKEFLVELRAVVSAMREEVEIDLPRALRTLVAGIPRPRVHLDVDPDLRVEAALAHTIFRCVQEAVTNAVRHAAAENVYVAVAKDGDAVEVTARDDGRGAEQVRVGHGLTGLRERIEGMGGRFQIEAQQGMGLTVRALLPARAGAA